MLCFTDALKHCYDKFDTWNFNNQISRADIKRL